MGGAFRFLCNLHQILERQVQADRIRALQSGMIDHRAVQHRRQLLGQAGHGPLHFHMHLAGAAGLTASDPSGGSIFMSVQQLGLMLEKQKAPMEKIVVDSAEKSPSEN
jgi:uncharacterized protein (TIGR03435 family)